MNKFLMGDFIVYSCHGVGRIETFEQKKIDGQVKEFMVLTFDRPRLTLRLPVEKAGTLGVRPLASFQDIQVTLNGLKSRRSVRSLPWARRFQEYETKLNSGLFGAIAEVASDLYHRQRNTKQTFSERQMYQLAFQRLTAEMVVVESISCEKATEKLEHCFSA